MYVYGDTDGTQHTELYLINLKLSSTYCEKSYAEITDHIWNVICKSCLHFLSEKRVLNNFLMSAKN